MGLMGDFGSSLAKGHFVPLKVLRTLRAFGANSFVQLGQLLPFGEAGRGSCVPQ